MEIENLSLRIDETSLNQVVAQYISTIPNLRELSIQFEPGVFVLKGKYFAVMYPVNFQVEFKPELQGPIIRFALGKLTIAGMPAFLFKNMLLEFLRDQLTPIGGVTVLENEILFDPRELLLKEGIPLKGQLKSFEVEKGFARIKAGTM